MRQFFEVIAIVICVPNLCIGAQSDPVSIYDLMADYAVVLDVTYLKADDTDLKLDIYAPAGNIYNGAGHREPVQTVVYIHGGGWVAGQKEADVLQFLPYLHKGWAVVNVEYRLGGVALAPAAVEDIRCAVWWVKRHAEEFGFDSRRVVLTGRSAGGHLALIAGMLPASAGLDRRCPGAYEPTTGSPEVATGAAELPELEVAAIVNWAGITDVRDLIDGANMKTYAVSWMGALPDRQNIATSISPLTHVRKGLPPILTLHGDKDSIVPYQHAVRLHQALDKANVANQLHTLKNRQHFSDFTATDIRKAFEVIDAFLIKYVPN